jgi:hypothetical protein
MKPQILFISPWPDAKNGEYELIERIQRAGYRVAVVDYLGFERETGECLNLANLTDEYDFAIAFNYETPCLINIPTFLWVANPLEFMNSNTYATEIYHNLRTYDDYLYNGSDVLKAHIARVAGPDWTDSGLEMFPSCAASQMAPPTCSDEKREHSAKISYCGVGWELASDKTRRAQGLLDELLKRGIVDFYGVAKLGATGARDEVPFDGFSLLKALRLYRAVLVVSSPAQLQSRIASNRVFEATAAGAPVISDRNPQVEALFGNSVYYYDGDTSEEAASSIVERLDEIKSNPEEASRRVTEAQKCMATRFCFENTFAKALAFTREKQALTVQEAPATIDVFLFHHDLDPEGKGAGKTFNNAAHVVHSLRCAVNWRGARARLFFCADHVPTELESLAALGVTVERVSPHDLGLENWDATGLGRKVARLALKSDADLTVFFSQFDHPHFDYFTRAIDRLRKHPVEGGDFLRLAGFYASGLDYETLPPPEAILRVSRPDTMYRWSQSSFAEHDLGALIFGRGAMTLLKEKLIGPFDAILAATLVAIAKVHGMRIHRSRHISLRVRFNNFQRHIPAWQRESAKGFWVQHYGLQANFTHEINALYDALFQWREGMDIADAVSGRNTLPVPTMHDADVRLVAENVRRVQGVLRKYHNFRTRLGLKRS